jgi:hypothetical protein
MKYFTPERYLCLGDLEDRQAFLNAQEEWERALTAYREQFARIEKRLPGGLRHLVASVSLHDARVVDMWSGRRSRFNVTLHPESDPTKLVVLAYSLVAPAQIIRESLPEAVRSTPVSWLYDELEIAKPAGNGKGPTTFSHNILLSNGWEVRLHFRGITVTRPDPIIPAAAGENVPRPSVSRSA